MNFPDIIYRNNNYLENLHATDNNENKNIIFIQQFYILKHTQNIQTRADIKSKQIQTAQLPQKLL